MKYKYNVNKYMASIYFDNIQYSYLLFDLNHYYFLIYLNYIKRLNLDNNTVMNYNYQMAEKFWFLSLSFIISKIQRIASLISYSLFKYKLFKGNNLQDIAPTIITPSYMIIKWENVQISLIVIHHIKFTVTKGQSW